MAYENFTTYTEFDEDSDITVDSATKVSWDTFNSRRSEAYLYKDKGVNHFSGDFIHKFEAYFSRADEFCQAAFWMISNTAGDFQSLLESGGDGVLFAHQNDTENLDIYLVENGAVPTQDSWASPGPQLSTLYFIEIVRDDDGGANNTGRYTVYIRTGSHAGALQDTLTIDCSAGEQNDFRYIFGMAGRHDSSINNGTSTGYTQNLDIGEAPAGWTGKIAGITNPAKINGVEVANIASVMGQ